ncbi:MAG: hypothetical protein UX17_C0070G0001 [Parcubacteria group bacterium GW2011_GWC2_45_7]|nr:MAG: hypothetical protein UX17_C0070G0001 [Parcubacteria group bacterium GW2011_GWC2_45_7]
MREGLPSQNYGKPKKESRKDDRACGFLKITTGENGLVRRFDMDTGKEISLLDMNPNDRKQHFLQLYEIVTNTLPEGITVDSWLFIIKLLDREKNVIGELTYAQTPDGMKIRNMESRVKGGGKVLLLKVLIDYPEIHRIFSNLVKDNLVAYKLARSEGHNHLEALHATPAYKNRSFCGFN